MFFYQTSCSWFKGKFCWSSPWGKSFRNTSLEQCSKPRVVPLKNCLGNSDYHNDDSSRSIHIYIHISIIWVNIISVIIKPTGILNTAHLGISIVFFNNPGIRSSGMYYILDPPVDTGVGNPSFPVRTLIKPIYRRFF